VRRVFAAIWRSWEFCKSENWACFSPKIQERGRDAAPGFFGFTEKRYGGFMQLGLIGLGKMGGNMAERLRLGGHQVVGFDFNAERWRG
jgi:phosphoglycerate dehydrogenase-like enzyme